MNLWKMFRTIFKPLFGTWGKTWNTLSTILGVGSGIASYYILKYPDKIPSYILTRDLVFLFFLTATILVLAIRYTAKVNIYEHKQAELRGEIISLQRSITDQLGYANDMTQRATQEIFHQYRSLFLKNFEIKATPDEFEIFRKICLSLTNHVRASLISHFHTLGINMEDDLSVSVKLILVNRTIKDIYPSKFLNVPRQTHQKDIRVITAFRDNKTWEASKVNGGREVTTSLYIIEENTAFDEIVNGRQDRFVEDNLTDLQRRGHYKNENPNWKLYYNSTLVVPMVLQESVKVPKDECRYLGFLAVDSLNPDSKKLYDSKECYHILNHAAITLANYFLVLILYHDK